MTVTISNDLALQLLEDRLDEVIDSWGDVNAKPLYMDMYESYVEGGCFDGCKDFSPSVIVDNDLINYCHVVYKEDKEFNALHKLAEEGERDISCQDEEITNGYSFIEAYNDDMLLVRW